MMILDNGLLFGATL